MRKKSKRTPRRVVAFGALPTLAVSKLGGGAFIAPFTQYWQGLGELRKDYRWVNMLIAPLNLLVALTELYPESYATSEIEEVCASQHQLLGKLRNARFGHGPALTDEEFDLLEAFGKAILDLLETVPTAWLYRADDRMRSNAKKIGNYNPEQPYEVVI